LTVILTSSFNTLSY